MLKLRHQNREYKDIWLVEPEVLIGSGQECDLVLPVAGVAPVHAVIKISGSELKVLNCSKAAGLAVNGVPFLDEHSLDEGNSLTIAGQLFVVVDPLQEMDAMLIENGQKGWGIRANHSALNNRIYPLAGTVVIGRSTDCDIVFTVTHLSRKHCELSVNQGVLKVKDLGSSNGTYVNGKRITEAVLHHNDELKLDTLCFTVIGPSDERDKTTVRAAVIPAQEPAANKNADTPAKPKASDIIRSREHLSANTPSQKTNDETAQDYGKVWGFVVLAVVIAVVVIFLLR